jgi:protein-S-isoprenylcysteine O-methyltransferase Ste14
MYLSLVLVLLALSVYFLSPVFLSSALGLWLVLDRIAVAPEESYLEEKFGETYSDYRRKAHRWI